MGTVKEIYDIYKGGRKKMNIELSKAGAAAVAFTVFLFAVFIISDFTFGSCFVCMILPIGFIMMTAGLHHEADEDRKVAADIGMILSAVYAVLILLVYFAQDTTVNLAVLNEQAADMIDFSRGGLFLNYDLLGYGMMALSTFFTGLSMKADSRSDKWLKSLLTVHGAFFPACFIMPMTGMFMKMADGSSGNVGDIALLIWCIYFIPVGVLAFRHFNNSKQKYQ